MCPICLCFFIFIFTLYGYISSFRQDVSCTGISIENKSHDASLAGKGGIELIRLDLGGNNIYVTEDPLPLELWQHVCGWATRQVYVYNCAQLLERGTTQLFI